MLYPDINSQKKSQQNSTRYRTALYLRLSREDGDKTESDSIANQRTLLEAYAIDHPELCIVDEFVDDGYSGSNFERPAFQNLFRELEQGTINCVLVKDLSRFGRNYIEVGRYLERIFPVMRVRLIAVTDNYDSQSAWKTSDSIMVPMRNLLNDAYCRDISVKIKSQLAVKRKRGDFVGSFATYGYQKDPSNHTKLIVDELAAENVQSVFRWKISGMSNQGIADRLNARKVPSPATRKLQSGAKLSLHFRKSDEPPWSAKAVDRILHNEVYIGKLVQGKTRRLDYRSKKKMNVPMRDWTIVDNTHEAIISAEQFELVQRILETETRRPNDAETVALFAGFLYCGDCGSADWNTGTSAVILPLRWITPSMARRWPMPWHRASAKKASSSVAPASASPSPPTRCPASAARCAGIASLPKPPACTTTPTCLLWAHWSPDPAWRWKSWTSSWTRLSRRRNVTAVGYPSWRKNNV